MTRMIADGVDAPIWPTGQLVATLSTVALAAIALVWVVLLCRRERIHWPALVLIGGTLTCLMEPLFDHLYGLWFREQGQWNLYTTFGSHQPVWVPAAYMAFYGGATVVIARVVTNKPAMRTVSAMYVSVAAMAIVAEVIYISVLRVYGYQDGQPFLILGYPIFLGSTHPNVCIGERPHRRGVGAGDARPGAAVSGSARTVDFCRGPVRCGHPLSIGQVPTRSWCTSRRSQWLPE